MTGALRKAFEAELTASFATSMTRDYERAFYYLGRTHILSQRHTLPHVRVHCLMLKLGYTLGNWKEVFGQATRIVAAALFSRVWIPTGNTGRANVSALRPMPIPDDLRHLL